MQQKSPKNLAVALSSGTHMRTTVLCLCRASSIAQFDRPEVSEDVLLFLSQKLRTTSADEEVGTEFK